MPHSLVEVIAPRPASRNHTVHAVLGLIRQRGLKPGDQLPPIRELAALLDVQPTVVRDALLQAQTMGLVRIVPRGGAFVQSLSYASLVDALASTLQTGLMQEDHNLTYLLEARNLLEIELAGRAAAHRRLEDLLPIRDALEAMARLRDLDRLADYVDLDIRFHREIGRVAGNSVLQTIQQGLLELLRTFLVRQRWTAERRDVTNRAHSAIYAALVAGDPEQVRAAMRAHLSMSGVLEDIQTLPEPRRRAKTARRA
ncbi:MAG: FCD domain-containing protein [Gemmataceae bacterium]|nr:FCD domain-containing protein [Gemmataceae bacterium]